MAISIVGKVKGLLEKDNNLKALDSIGLGAVVIEKPPVGHQPSIRVGSLVVVNHGLFPWINTYQKGSTGVVLAVWGCPIQCPDKERYDLIEVRLDNPLTDKQNVTFSRWELEEIKNDS